MSTDDAGLESTTQDDAQDDVVRVAAFSVGSQLKAARETKGLTVAEVSRSLKLSLRQVQAIEIDDWKSLPSKAIVRGFIRNYARLLGIDYGALLPALESLQTEDVVELHVPSGPQVDLPRQGRFASRDTLWILAGLIVLLFGVSVSFVLPDAWWQGAINTVNSIVKSDKDSESAQDVTDEGKTVSGEQENEQDLIPPPSGEAAAEETTVPLESGEATGQSVEIPQAPSTPPATPPVSSAASSGLKFSFQRDSWVEVRDRTGLTIMAQVNRAGESREVTGEPPFALIIGNASHVTLSYQGKPVDLSNRSKGDVARITLK